MPKPRKAAIVPLGDAIMDAMADLDEFKPETAEAIASHYADLFEAADAVGWAEVVSQDYDGRVAKLARDLGIKVA